MKNSEKYLHQWELNEQSLLLRFYFFWYAIGEPKKDEITFCKLFWAVVLAPLMVIVYAGADLRNHSAVLFRSRTLATEVSSRKTGASISRKEECRMDSRCCFLDS